MLTPWKRCVCSCFEKRNWSPYKLSKTYAALNLKEISAVPFSPPKEIRPPIPVSSFSSSGFLVEGSGGAYPSLISFPIENAFARYFPIP